MKTLVLFLLLCACPGVADAQGAPKPAAKPKTQLNAPINVHLSRTKPKGAPTKPSRAALQSLKPVPAPAAKGGKKTKAPTFGIHIDNRTAHYVDVYIDNTYRGTVGPWGDSYYYTESPTAAIYCESEDGGIACDHGQAKPSPGSYTIRIYP